MNWGREDIRSHKKFYYAMQEYPDDMIITIDDDVYYRSDTIELLYQTHLKYPQDVCANLTRVLKFRVINLLCMMIALGTWNG